MFPRVPFVRSITANHKLLQLVSSIQPIDVTSNLIVKRNGVSVTQVRRDLGGKAAKQANRGQQRPPAIRRVVVTENVGQRMPGLRVSPLGKEPPSVPRIVLPTT